MDSKIRKKFYKLSDASSDTRGFAWCPGYGPIDSMPFLTDEYIERQRQFWEVNKSRPLGMLVDDGNPWAKAKKWPDFLGHGGGIPSFFVSEKVVETLNREAISYFRLTEIPVGEIDSKGLKEQEPPKYYVLEVEPGLHLNYEASMVPLDEQGAPQFQLRPSHFGVWNIGRLETWNGSDLFAWEGFPAKILSNLLCTERIIEIAKKYKWTNVKFDPVWAQ